MRISLFTRFTGAAFLLALLTITLARDIWPVAILDHLGLQFLWVALAGLAVSLLIRDWFALVWAACALIPIWSSWDQAVAPLSAMAMPSNTPSNPVVTVFHANIDKAAPSTAPLIAHLNKSDADIVFLQEVTPQTLSEISSALHNHHLVLGNPLANTQGSAMFAHADFAGEILDPRIEVSPNPSKRPLLVARVRIAETEIALMSVHLTRPKATTTLKAQARELQDIATWAQHLEQTGTPVVAIGDFNASATSRVMRRFRNASGLVDSQTGYLMQMTWPARVPLFAQIAIDHALHSPQLETVARKTGPDIGSDHLPLKVSLALKR